jgi:hypothetical protein
MDYYLKQFSSEKFEDQVAFAGTIQFQRELILGTTEFDMARAALLFGFIDEQSIRDFVADLMKDFRRGERFPHEIALAAIAVLLEVVSIPFSEEYLIDLARLKLAEISRAARMARESLKHRQGPGPQVKRVQFSMIKGEFSSANPLRLIPRGWVSLAVIQDEDCYTPRTSILTGQDSVGRWNLVVSERYAPA